MTKVNLGASTGLPEAGTTKLGGTVSPGSNASFALLLGGGTVPSHAEALGPNRGGVKKQDKSTGPADERRERSAGSQGSKAGDEQLAGSVRDQSPLQGWRIPVMPNVSAMGAQAGGGAGMKTAASDESAAGVESQPRGMASIRPENTRTSVALRSSVARDGEIQGVLPPEDAASGAARGFGQLLDGENEGPTATALQSGRTASEELTGDKGIPEQKEASESGPRVVPSDGAKGAGGPGVTAGAMSRPEVSGEDSVREGNLLGSEVKVTRTGHVNHLRVAFGNTSSAATTSADKGEVTSSAAEPGTDEKQDGPALAGMGEPWLPDSFGGFVAGSNEGMASLSSIVTKPGSLHRDEGSADGSTVRASGAQAGVVSASVPGIAGGAQSPLNASTATASAMPKQPDVAGAGRSSGLTPAVVEHLGASGAARAVTAALRSDLRIGVQTEAFGKVTIHTSTDGGQLSAQLALEDIRQGTALVPHLSGVEQRLAHHYGMDASVSVISAADHSTRGQAASGEGGSASFGGQQRSREEGRGGRVLRSGSTESSRSLVEGVGSVPAPGVYDASRLSITV